MADIAFNDRLLGFNDRSDGHDTFFRVGLPTGAQGDVFPHIGPTLGDPDAVFLGIDPRFAGRADVLSRIGATLDDGDNIVLGTEDSDVLFALGGDDTLFALGGADRVDAGGGDDAVDGGSGDDRLGGADGDDRLFGGSGNDGLFGSSGNDQLSGGDGVDTVVGGSGDDVLIGGADGDTFAFVFAGTFDSIVGDPSQGNDTIEDFQPGVDRIRISGLLERLDTNLDGRLDEGDRRVDVDHEGPASVTIDLTGLPLVDGRQGEGSLTILGVDHLAVHTDAIVGTDIFLF